MNENGSDSGRRLNVVYTDERGIPDGGARVRRDAGDAMPCGCSKSDTVCLAGSAAECHARQAAIAAERRQRDGIAAAAQTWADDIDRRAFDHAWATIYELVPPKTPWFPDRVRSGRERLGE